MTDIPFLFPAPQQIKRLLGYFQIGDQSTIALIHTSPDLVLQAIQILKAEIFNNTGCTWASCACQEQPDQTPGLVLQIIPDIFPNQQSYRLLILPDLIRLIAADPAGAYYGIQTLVQIIHECRQTLPCLEIFDYPDFIVRGVMLDISRDRVPTMETLFQLVDRLASIKINQLQLYTEHTFAYRRHHVVWENASPMTSDEVLILDQYCKKRFVELVPNQNSFGHMHRWLKYPEYAHLAEIHGSFESPWGTMEGPFSLCPLLPESMELLTGLYDELLPNFQSKLFNVGCDETIDLGEGKSKVACEQQGAGQIYLDFLLKIQKEVSKRNHVMQFWGDIILQHPDLISKIPGDVIALEWGYEADHPFGDHGQKFAESGIPFYVCPGTSSWNSIAGRTDNALGNLRKAAESGLKNGALGYLITDWGDNGHWQQLPVSFLGFYAGAGYSWAYRSNKDSDIKKALTRFAFHDPSGTAGEIVYTLGNLYKEVGIIVHNASILFTVLQNPLSSMIDNQEFGNYQIINIFEILQNTRGLLAECKFTVEDGSVVADELEFTINMLNHACNRINYVRGKADKQVMLNDLDSLLVEFERLWLQRSRKGGLRDSLSRLQVIRNDYL